MPIPTDLERSITAFGDVYRRAEARIHAELLQILDDPNQGARVRRLRALADEIDRRTSRLEAEARAFLNSSLPSAWSAGAMNAAVGEFTWTQGHRQALGLLAQDTYSEVLRSTRFMSRDVKSLIRSESSSVLSTKVITGQTALGAGREIEERLRRMGVSAVTYADGRNIRASTYAEMLARTKTAAAYNLGGLNQLRGAGITHVEGIDSGDCGLTSHSDPFKVNGKVFPIEVAGAYPIGHPNCVRDFASRPDITRDEDAAVASSWRSPEAAADQANFERYLRETQTPARAAGRAPREARTTREPRTPRTPQPQQTPEDRLRALYGDKLRQHLQGSGEGARAELERLTDTYVNRLAQLPESVHRTFLDMGGSITVTNGPVGVLPGMSGATRDGRSWDSVAGAFQGNTGTVMLGDGPHGSASLSLHEFGHGMDWALGKANGWDVWRSAAPDFQAQAAKLANDTAVNPYFRGSGSGSKELFAESFAAHARAISSPALDLGGHRDVAAYLEQLFEGFGVVRGAVQ